MTLFSQLLVSSRSLTGFNQPEQIINYPIILVPLITVAVRAGLLGCSTPNTWKIILRPLFPQLFAISSSSTGLNYIELMKYSSMILVLSIT